ncbi:MAG: hypothetical protein JXR51_04860 [Bacteroidales bacterium]|nr:hypothetical protein [Bacteroidales bacterium]
MRKSNTILIIILISFTTACFNNSSNPLYTQEETDSIEKSNKLLNLYLDSAFIELNNWKHAEAIPFLDKCIDLNPNWHYLYNLRACCYMHKNSINDSLNNRMAVKDFSKAIFLYDKISDYYNNRGWSYQMLENYAYALSDFKSAASISPDSVYLHNNILRVLFLTHKNKLALELADSLILNFTDCGYAYYIRGHLKRDYLHKYIEGNKDIKKSKELDWEKGVKIIY